MATEVWTHLRVKCPPVHPEDVARKADLVSGDEVNYSLESVDTGVKWIDGSSVYRRVFITATKDYPGQRVPIIDIPNGWGFRGLVRLSGYLIAVNESGDGEIDYLPIGFTGGSNDGTYDGSFIHVWIDSDGVIYETHQWDIFHNRPLILIVDYITAPVGGTTAWDGGATLWDNGTTAWDVFIRQLLDRIARSEARKAALGKTELTNGIRNRPDQTGRRQPDDAKRSRKLRSRKKRD